LRHLGKTHRKLKSDNIHPSRKKKARKKVNQRVDEQAIDQALASAVTTSIANVVTCGRYAFAARSRMYTSSKESRPFDPPKRNRRLSARIVAW
jgi:hypothetical protein